MDKQHILNEMKRTAEANGGRPLGVRMFSNETGIKATDWEGKFWARWGDAVREAGFAPNQMAQPYAEELLIRRFIDLIRELGRFPVQSELRLFKARNNPDFPSDKAFRRLGRIKHERILRVLNYCKEHAGFEDIATICQAAAQPDNATSDEDSRGNEEIGFVYLLKSGRHYKIGRTNATGRRERELAIQLPEKAKLVHEIRTDAPSGIEAYWHRRFDSQRQNGEWFALSSADVNAFKRRKFM